MKKNCEICSRFSSKKKGKNIGYCDFANHIPCELKYEFAYYCDFFDLKNV